MVRTRGGCSFEQAHPIYGPLYAALLADDADRVAELCRQGALPAPAGPWGITPLHLAALLDAGAAVPALLAAGASPDTVLVQTFDEDTREADAWPLTAKLGRDQRESLQKGSTPLDVAIRLSHATAATALLTAGNTLWGLLNANYRRHWPAGVLRLLAQHVADGGLTANSQQLGRLVGLFSWIRTTDAAAACLQVLQAAERGQIAVLQEDAQRALQLSVDAGNVVLAHLAVKLGAEGTAELASNAVHWAWSSGRVKVLGILLSAGAPITHYIMSLVYEYMRPAVLEVLLRHGALPALSEVFFRHPFSPKRCACPVLRLLQCNAQPDKRCLGLNRYQTPLAQKGRNTLLIAEQLVAAGLRPTVYRNVVLKPGSLPVAEYDPLKKLPAEEWDLEGCNRYVWLALQGEPWSPATHAKHPPALRAAFRMVLLCAARGTQAAGGRTGSATRQQPASSLRPGAACRGLAELPQDVVLQVFCLAARPLSAWVPEEE